MATTNITKEGIVVEKGQIWRDLDKRMTNRHCKVEDVRDGKAIMYRCTDEGLPINAIREVKVSVGRMHKGSTGWALVHGNNGKVTTVAPIKAVITSAQRAQYSFEE